MKHAGYYATRALRVEKFYAFWGQDLDTRTTPLECGRVWRVKFDVIRFILRYLVEDFHVYTFQFRFRKGSILSEEMLY